MKLSASLCLLLITGFLHAQVSDSTQLKLQQYKTLYEKNLINSAEYQQLKSRLLQIPFNANTYPDSTRAKALRERYQGRITGGAILLSVGIGTLIGTGIANAVIPLSNPGDYPHTPWNNFLTTDVVGGVTAIVGGVIFGLGMRDKFIFCNEYLAISVTGNDNQIGLACNF